MVDLVISSEEPGESGFLNRFLGYRPLRRALERSRTDSLEATIKEAADTLHSFFNRFIDRVESDCTHREEVMLRDVFEDDRGKSDVH